MEDTDNDAPSERVGNRLSQVSVANPSQKKKAKKKVKFKNVSSKMEAEVDLELWSNKKSTWRRREGP